MCLQIIKFIESVQQQQQPLYASFNSNKNVAISTNINLLTALCDLSMKNMTMHKW